MSWVCQYDATAASTLFHVHRYQSTLYEATASRRSNIGLLQNIDVHLVVSVCTYRFRSHMCGSVPELCLRCPSFNRDVVNGLRRISLAWHGISMHSCTARTLCTNTNTGTSVSVDETCCCVSRYALLFHTKGTCTSVRATCRLLQPHMVRILVALPPNRYVGVSRNVNRY